MTVTRSQKARKPRRCDSCNRPSIKAGDIYLQHTALRGDEFGYHEYGDGTRPNRSAECSACATRYGRGDLVNPTSEPTP